MYVFTVYIIMREEFITGIIIMRTCLVLASSRHDVTPLVYKLLVAAPSVQLEALALDNDYARDGNSRPSFALHYCTRGQRAVSS